MRGDIGGFALIRFLVDAARRYRRIRKLQRMPYPVVLPPQTQALTTTVEQSFDCDVALELNEARIRHLKSLQLPLAGKSLLDVGAGVGHLAARLLELDCQVTCVDGRAENVAEIQRRLPNVRAEVADVENTDLSTFGEFDAVFCYGLLYHVENPVMALRNMAKAAKELLLLETLVCDSYQPVMYLVEEPPTPNQALRGFGCRPSPSFIVLALKRLGFYVYAAKEPPAHPCYHIRWRDSLRIWDNGLSLRAVFVASRQQLHSPHIVEIGSQ
jgi:SAM-dependent methyltransferase